MKKTLFNRRLCVVTKKKYYKDELLKITREEDEWVISDKSYSGRSIYLLNNKETIEKFLSFKSYKIRYFTMNEKLREGLLKHAQNL